jgi:hypothetical protein
VFVKPDWSKVGGNGVPMAVYNNTQADAFRCVMCLGYRGARGAPWLAARDFYVGHSSSGTDYALIQEGDYPSPEVTGEGDAFSVVFCQNLDGQLFRCRSSTIQPDPANVSREEPEWVHWYKAQLVKAEIQQRDRMVESLKAFGTHSHMDVGVTPEDQS